ncbi:hypothetical protein Y032_0032g2472 [Ancylostoma ceylanicum]|uniref:Uncharacterized protein n=1 Tax=Ancylostoma ceylanicum TaxID=53326 RepID=A0A016UNI8_9BILA|nr:hypothetical protein Y032_0032g2472 [Ancylostoma ceylanicum]
MTAKLAEKTRKVEALAMSGAMRALRCATRASASSKTVFKLKVLQGCVTKGTLLGCDWSTHVGVVAGALKDTSSAGLN